MRTVWVVILLMCATALQAQAQAQAQAQEPELGAKVRYISDETAITLRADRSIDAPVSGLLKSGARVELIETDPGSAYSRIRAGGLEGWVLTRYLSAVPAARERLAQAEAQLAELRARVETQDAENLRLRAAAETAAGGSSARGILADAEPEPGRLTRVLTAAGLVLVGLLSGLLIPQLPGVRRRRPRRGD